MANNPVILFDGVCNLCNRSVQFVISHDPDAYFKFASLQSETGKNLLQQYRLPVDDPGSIVLIDQKQVYTQTSAALRIAKKLRGPVKLLYGFIIVPPLIRDLVYRFIAKNRYNWFGKRDECMIPTGLLKDRFLN